MRRLGATLLAAALCLAAAARGEESVRSLLDRAKKLRVERKPAEAAALLTELLGRLPERGTERAEALLELGHAARALRELDASAARYGESLALSANDASLATLAGEALNGLGAVAHLRGDLEDAEARYREALSRLDGSPASKVAPVLSNLGLVLSIRGDLAAAEEALRQALLLQETERPDPLRLSGRLNTLASIAQHRGHLEAAETYLRRALGLCRGAAPGGPDEAQTLHNLGALALARRRFDEAEELFSDALKLKRSLPDRERTTPITLLALGDAARAAGSPGRAAELFHEALALLRPAAAGSERAPPLLRLAALALDGDRLPEAEALLFRALADVAPFGPGSGFDADALHALARVRLRSGRAAEAETLLCSAVEALEAHRARLGDLAAGTPGFDARFADVYFDLAALLVDVGRPEDAFRTAERSRARSLLGLMASRDLVIAEERAAGIEPRRRALEAEYDRLQASIARASDAEERRRLLDQKNDVRRRLDALADELRKTSARVAAVRAPEPLGAEAARAALDPGTTLLLYLVGERSTLLFTVGAPGAEPLSARRIAVGREELRERVERFRNLVSRPSERRLAELQRQGTGLFSDLLGPATAEIGRADRLLVSPDGPLHALPFAALVSERTEEGEPVYLVERKPLHVVASATLYDELRRRRAAAGSRAPRLLAFADPRPATTPGLTGLSPLPSSREEALSIARVFGGAARVVFGADATERLAKAIPPETTHVHFAAHALLDEAAPLESSLVLAPSADGAAPENGRLQAWELFGRVRIDANLVALSACESALGVERGGEGLIGLTRAFHYAGARSVLASLWTVADDAASTLMAAFYDEHIGKKLPKDEALRRAQLLQMRPARRHPYFWATFQLYGDRE